MKCCVDFIIALSIAVASVVVSDVGKVRVPISSVDHRELFLKRPSIKSLSDCVKVLEDVSTSWVVTSLSDCS